MEWVKLWIGLGTFIWIVGFIKAVKIKEAGLPFDRALVRPPYLIYLVCGLPKSKKLPVGVMSVLSIVAQLIGLLWILYGIAFPSLKALSLMAQGILLNCSMVLIIIYGWYLYKQNLYKD